MFKTNKFLFIACFLISSMLFSVIALGAENNDCVLPVPDGAGIETSEPQTKGIIVRINSKLIDINTKHESEHIRIRVDDKTRFFTIYGGYVSKEKLKVGQYVSIWYVGCNPEQADFPPLAAVVQLESTRPEDSNIK